MNSNDMVIVTH